ncbi:MAG: hypothetical protein CK546_03185 [Pedosphaera sp.]|nr:hypothetical protein [Pedosphaera sp.]PHX95313.1 MAG: hypothetical protein CK546_03185 [Pedosphaera sp.]
MSTLEEIKAAAEQVSAEDRYELLHWLAGSEDVRRRDLEELRRAIAIGVAQADQGERAPLDIKDMERGRPRPRSNHCVSMSMPSAST